ncbi:MAG TPA: toll/interleukin-1 receptor domain-containing protein, partial [Aquabacterium sp.]|nr:toll/interleukin-1 receptor domain-containing protein [Aquabacterium sp.]
MKRLFISYRGTDGRKVADRLAQALIQRFGTEQVAHHPREPWDAHSWHDELLHALGRQPIVLVVLTPDLFGARSSSGQVCMEDPDDPVRRELESALLTRATLIPLLTDQVLMPDAAHLPLSLRPFTECQPLHLHSSHWSEDLERLCTELQSTGLTRPLGGDPHR